MTQKKNPEKKTTQKKPAKIAQKRNAAEVAPEKQIAPQIEIVKADYFDDTTIEVKQNNVIRANIGGNRLYARVVDDGSLEYSYSVTTIIRKYSPASFGLIEWLSRMTPEQADFEKNASADYGTYLHYLFGEILKRQSIHLSHEYLYNNIREFEQAQRKRSIEFNSENVIKWLKGKRRDIRKDVIGFIQWAQDYKIKPMAIEVPLWTKEYSGTIDLIAQVENKTILVDYKTSYNDFYPDHEIQLYAYKKLWEANYPEIKIDATCNYGCKDFRLPIGKTVTPYRFKDQTESKVRYKWDIFLEMASKEMTTEFSQPEIIPMIVNIDTKVDDMIGSVDYSRIAVNKNETGEF